MTPIEQYIATLTQLTGDDFEHEVASRLQIEISDFQPIVSKPNGDGGLDGASDDYTIGYCCYGPEYDSFKNEKEINADIIDKFKSDLRRILELGADDDANAIPEHPAPNSPK